MWLMFVLMSFAVYRITRLVLLDSWIDGFRSKAYEAILSPLSPEDRFLVLTVHQEEVLETLPAWRKKLYQLLSCPYCFSGWVSLAVLVGVDVITEADFEAWFLWWMGIWTGALLVYTIIDSD